MPPRGLADRDGWQERVKGIHAVSTPTASNVLIDDNIKTIKKKKKEPFKDKR